MIRVAGWVGLVLLAIGAVWLLQGAGLLRGSPMTGERFWMVVGAVLVLAGAAMRMWYRRERRRRLGA